MGLNLEKNLELEQFQCSVCKRGSWQARDAEIFRVCRPEKGIVFLGVKVLRREKESPLLLTSSVSSPSIDLPLVSAK